MMGIKRIEKIRNEEIRAREDVAKISKKNKRSENDIVRPYGEKDWRGCSNENIE